MGQSLVKNYLHIIFTTKNRKPWITSYIEEELHQYLGGICNNLDCQAIKVGGFKDHVHILCMLSKKITITSLLEKLKSNSSKWIKTKGDEFGNFYWQDGYGAFSVRPSDVDNLIDYISNQHLKHQNKTFQEEYREFLDEYKIDFNERYVWD